MSDDDITPVVNILDLARKDCERKMTRCKESIEAKLDVVDQRLDRKHDQLLELVGVSGKNGRVGQMRKELNAVIDEQQKTKSLLLKLMLTMATSSAIGAGASHAILKLL